MKTMIINFICLQIDLRTSCNAEINLDTNHKTKTEIKKK